VGAVFYDAKNTEPLALVSRTPGFSAALVTVPKYDMSIIADSASFKIGAKLLNKVLDNV
jgi:hypothetical protein